MEKGSEQRVLDDDEVWGLHGKLLGNLENEASNQHFDTLLGLRVEGGISTEESVDPTQCLRTGTCFNKKAFIIMSNPEVEETFPPQLALLQVQHEP